MMWEFTIVHITLGDIGDELSWAHGRCLRDYCLSSKIRPLIKGIRIGDVRPGDVRKTQLKDTVSLFPDIIVHT